jgi:hypothetical protein
MIIDLEGFDDITTYHKHLPGRNFNVTFGGGVRLGNLDTYTINDKAAISHGTCAGIGVGGHFTHGGYGHSKSIGQRQLL